MFRLVVAGVVLAVLSSPARAEVRLGNNVRIGGHDFSNQTYGPGRNAVIHLHDQAPRHAGCRWVVHRDGSRTKVCHLKTRPHGRD